MSTYPAMREIDGWLMDWVAAGKNIRQAWRWAKNNNERQVAKYIKDNYTHLKNLTKAHVMLLRMAEAKGESESILHMCPIKI
jgi:hypothetical protein